MKRIVLCALVFLVCSCTASTSALPQAKHVTRVISTQTSGPVPLEQQWREQVVIEASRVLLVRTGPPEATALNDGHWELRVESQTVSRLLEGLAAMASSSIHVVPSRDYLGRGALSTYEIQYADSSAMFLADGEGQTYGEERVLVEPIAEFIAGLALPADAARWHTTPSDAEQSDPLD